MRVGIRLGHARRYQGLEATLSCHWYLTASGVGIVIGGELLRGPQHRWEFGHVPLNVDGPAVHAGNRMLGSLYFQSCHVISLFRRVI